MMETDRIEKLLLALLLEQMGDAPQKKKARVLRRIGFKNQEIAEMLETSTGAVAQSLYEARQGKGDKSPKPKVGKKG